MDKDNGNSKEDSSKKNTSWHPQQEKILKNWSEIGSSYRYLHDKSFNKYERCNMCFSLPVIILSTLTGVANFAQSKQVIIVGPSTLIMCMKLVESIWKLEKQNKNSKEIAEIAGGMYDQIAKTINLLNRTHSSLSKSIENIEESKKYIKDGKSSLFIKANKMSELGANNRIKIVEKD